MAPARNIREEAPAKALPRNITVEMIAAFQPVLAWLDAGAPMRKAKGRVVLHLSMQNFLRRTENTAGDCGTTCCIAGALTLFSDVKISETKDPSTDASAVGKKIGMTDAQIDNLFFAQNFRKANGAAVGLEYIRPAEAAFAIRKMLDTGLVRWPERVR